MVSQRRCRQFRPLHLHTAVQAQMGMCGRRAAFRVEVYFWDLGCARLPHIVRAQGFPDADFELLRGHFVAFRRAGRFPAELHFGQFRPGCAFGGLPPSCVPGGFWPARRLPGGFPERRFGRFSFSYFPGHFPQNRRLSGRRPPSYVPSGLPPNRRFRSVIPLPQSRPPRLLTDIWPNRRNSPSKQPDLGNRKTALGRLRKKSGIGAKQSQRA